MRTVTAYKAYGDIILKDVTFHQEGTPTTNKNLLTGLIELYVKAKSLNAPVTYNRSQPILQKDISRKIDTMKKEPVSDKGKTTKGNNPAFRVNKMEK